MSVLTVKIAHGVIPVFSTTERKCMGAMESGLDRPTPNGQLHFLATFISCIISY
jgi:hypothetical protein